VANEAISNEATLRRKIRRSEIFNTLAILFFAVGIPTLAVFLFARWNARHPQARSESGPSKIVAVPATPTPIAQVKAPAEVVVPAPAKTPASVEPRPSLPSQGAAASKPRKSEATTAPPAPEVRPRPPEPTVVSEVAPAELSAMEYPSAPAAKRVLVSIKCFDQFAFERKSKGRQYFSALCMSGERRQVSCQGAGCRIEY
jgi:hypothetical protein